MMQSPFLLQNQIIYDNWRLHKLRITPDYLNHDSSDSFINIENSALLTTTEKNAMIQACKHNNLCLYRIKNPQSDTKANIHKLAAQIGLNQLDSNICADNDSLTSITQKYNKGQHDYIPYSSKRSSWHTDGYYNPAEKQINSMLFHCIRPAKEGGESLLLDHEIAYLLLRDENPAFIEALMQADAMTIPANILDGKIIREAQTGPVFSINQQGGLHMRYSARKRNIEWSQSGSTLEAVAFLENLLENNSKYLIKHTLQAGEGLICKNILHRRTQFVDYDNPEKKRLLYRGRYFDHIANN